MGALSRLNSLRDNSFRLLQRTPSLVFAMAVLGAGLTLASSVLVKGIRTASDTITVTGSSTERIKSDFVEWEIDVLNRGETRQSSYLGVIPSVQRTIAHLKEGGFLDQEIEISFVNSKEDVVRNPKTGELVSRVWKTNQRISIRTEDVDKVKRVRNSLKELLADGVYVNSYAPAYTYSKLSEKRVDMLVKATRDARNRAIAILRETGADVGGVTNVNTGVFQITTPNSTRVSSYGSYDTTTIDKDITAVMGVTFRVK